MRSIILGLEMVAASCAPAIEDAKAEQTRPPLATSPIQRCMNLGNALDSPRKEGEWGYTVRRSDMQLLKDGWTNANQVIVADLTGDGHLDIVAAAERGSNEVRWWRNEGVS